MNSVERVDAAVETRPFLADLSDEGPDARADPCFGIFQEASDRRLELAPALGKGEAALQQDRAQLVHQHGAHADQPRPDPVQALHVELLLRLQRHEAHGRARGRLGDRLGIAVVVLLRLDVGADVLGRHQPDGVPLHGEQPAEVVGAAAGLHRHHAGRQLGRQADNRLSPRTPSQHHRPGRVEADETAAVLAEVDAQHRD